MSARNCSIPRRQLRRQLAVARRRRLGALALRFGEVSVPPGSVAEAVPSATLAEPGEVLGHVGHRFGRAGELAAPLVAAGREVAPRGAIEVASRLHVIVGIFARLPGAEPLEPLVRA